MQCVLFLCEMEDISIASLHKISNHNVQSESITPELFVEFVNTNLHHNCVCSSNNGIHTFSACCNERLFVLSAVRACFEFSIGSGGHSISSEDQSCNKTLSFEVPAVNERKRDDQSCGTNVKSEDMKKLNDKGNELRRNELDLREKWYIQTCDLCATDRFVYQLLSSHERSVCMFATHMIKTIIVFCAVHYNKIAIVLKFMEDRRSKTKNFGTFEFDIIKMFLSKKHEIQNDVRTLVYKWFVGEMPSSLRDSFTKKLTEKTQAHFQDNLAMLSVFSKLLKFSMLHKMETPSFIITAVLEILKFHKDMFIKDKMGRIMFWKFLKVLNNLIHIQFCFEKAALSASLLNVCVMIKQHFPSLFEMSDRNGYFTSIQFWESKDLVNDGRHSPNSNVVIVREIVMLAIKASVVLIRGEKLMKDEGINCVLTVYECVNSWMEKHYDRTQLGMGWITVLFGDQDDKWIVALLSLLIINQNSCHESIKRKTKPYANDGSEDQSAPLAMNTVTNSYDSNHGTTSTTSKIKPDAMVNTFWKSICPFRLFYHFTKFISFDHLVISDFLISPETEFLEYFTKYLMYLKNNWDIFLIFCTKQNESISHHIEPSLNNYVTYSSPVLISDLKEGQNLSESEMTCASSAKRQNHDILKGSPPAKLMKAKQNARPLVLYPDSDTATSDDENVAATCSHGFENQTDPNRLRINESLAPLNLSHPATMNSELSANKVTSIENFTSSNSMKDPAIWSRSSSISSDNESIDSDENEKVDRSSENENVVSSENESENENVVSSENESENENVVSSVNENVDISENEKVDSNVNEKVDSSENENVDSSSENVLERMMTMLIRLRLHIERLDNYQLIPYKSHVLLNLLSICEDKYETVT